MRSVLKIKLALDSMCYEKLPNKLGAEAYFYVMINAPVKLNRLRSVMIGFKNKKVCELQGIMRLLPKKIVFLGSHVSFSVEEVREG